MCISNYIKGCRKTKIFAIQGLVYTVAFISLNIIFLLYMRIGLPGYLLSIIIASTVSSIYMLLTSKCYLDLYPFAFDKQACKEMLQYSLPMIPTTVAWWINASADRYMILSFIGVDANGLYGVAHKIPTILTTFTYIFSQAWRISAISTYSDSDKQKYYSNVYKFYSLVCMYGCLGLVVISDLLAKLLFKSEFYQAWTLIPPLVIAALFEANSGFLASIYSAAKKTKFLSVSVGIGALLNICLNFILIPYVGAMGAAFATMLSFISVWIIRLLVLKNFILIAYDIRKTTLSLCLVIITGLFYSFNIQCKYLFGCICSLCVLILNLNVTLQIIKQLLQMVIHMFKK